MHPTYPNVFRPIRLGPVELRNRFYTSPQSMPLNIGGKPSDDFIAYNVARAEGGSGLIMVSMACSIRGRSVQPSPHPEAFVPAWRALAEGVHAKGAKIFAEPYYHWSTPGIWQVLSPTTPQYTPSPAQFLSRDVRSTSREANREAIAGLTEALRQSVANLRDAGFDGIMLHAAHGALFEHFLSPYFNRRTDEYGGSLENRMRLLVDSLTMVRETAGPHMAVGIRLNCDEMLTGGYGTEEACRILERLASSGLIDFADLDVAVEPDQFWIGMPSVLIEPHPYRPYVEAVRKAAGEVPVLSVLGRLSSIAEAEAVIGAGVCEMVGAARAMICEPDLVRNAEAGREDRSRTCIHCNWCWGGFPEGIQVCTINPATYRERYWRTVEPAPQARKVVVVGAGPAGLEAARTCALRGHDVVLMERDEEPGGALRLWAKLPDRGVYTKAIDFWRRELERLKVDVRCGMEATADGILAERPDAVIVATGSRYSEEGRSNHRDYAIPGHERPIVHMPEHILASGALPTGKVLIVDGEGLNCGVGIAELLASKGAEVEVVSPLQAVMSSRLAATQESPIIYKRLKQASVKLSPMTYVAEIGEGAVTLYDIHTDAQRVVENVDAVVLATGRIPQNHLERQLLGRVEQVFAIGDAMAVRTWTSAAFEGHRFARYIGEPDAPRSVEEAYFGGDDPLFTPLPADLARA